MEGFEPPRRFSTPTSRFSRPFPSTAWVHLQMYSRSNVSRKKERNLERNPDFLLISCRRNPLKTQGKLKNGFQNTLPFSRPFPSTAWVHLQMYFRSNVSRKKERNLERSPDFFLISYSRDPLKTQGKLKNGFQNTLPFSRLPRYVRFGNSPWRAERLYAQKSYHKSPVLSIEKRRCTTIFGRKGLHKGHFMI